MRYLIAFLALAAGAAFAQQPPPPTLEQMQERLEAVIYQRNLLENRVIELGQLLKDANKKTEACKPETKDVKK